MSSTRYEYTRLIWKLVSRNCENNGGSNVEDLSGDYAYENLGLTSFEQ